MCRTLQQNWTLVIALTLKHVLLHREEIEKQKAKERYMKMHLAGKTDQAKADLARLAIIRKQREDAARKKEEEKKGKYLTCAGIS